MNPINWVVALLSVVRQVALPKSALEKGGEPTLPLSPKVRRIIQIVGAALLALAGGYSVIPDAESSPPRTLPHDHSSRGKGGALGEFAIDCIQPSTLAECVLKPTEFGIDVLDGSGPNSFIQFKESVVLGEAITGVISSRPATDFRIENRNNGTPITFYSDDISGTALITASFDADIGPILNWTGGGSSDERLSIQDAGMEIRGRSTNGTDSAGTNTQDTQIEFENASGTEIGQIGWGGFVAETGLELINRVEEGLLSLIGTNSGASEVVLWSGDAQNELVTRVDTCSVIKKTDTSRASTTTVTADPDLTCTGLDSTADYAVELFVQHTHNGGGIRFDMATGATSQYMGRSVRSAAATVQDHAFTTTVQTIANVGSTPWGTTLHGSMSGSTAVTFRWAQNTSNAGNTTVQDGSWLRVTKMAND